MYTILENARIVIALLKEHNIRHIVISPGGSNIPIVQGVQQDPFFTCYSVVDERSAMYFAIGLYLELGVPIATSCTSAQATRNYVPGLTEAFYKKVPILAITMSKHPKYLGQEYMQCPIQTSLPVDAVKKSYTLPRINDDNDRLLCVRTANEAILELTHHNCGPVQLNIEELDSETWHFDSNANLPKVRCIRRYSIHDKLRIDLSNKRVMILIGEHRPFDVEEASAIENFCKLHNAIVYADHISNYHGEYTINGNQIATALSQTVFNQKYIPDVVITLGGLTGDYGIYNLLVQAPSEKVEHWRINKDGEVVDTYGKLTKIFEMGFLDFQCFFVEEENGTSHTYYEEIIQLQKASNLSVELPLSNMFVAQQLHSKIPAGSTMHFAILNSLRVWNVFPLDSSIRCFSNVAAFGIDGCMSTMIGQSVSNNGGLVFHVTGDLSFYYDMNSLAIRHIGKNIRVILINNNGGVEFKLGNLQQITTVGDYIAADNHFRNAKGWAETCGFRYLSVRTKEELVSVESEFCSSSEEPILMEVFVSEEDERKANCMFFSENKVQSLSEKIKDGIKKGVKDVAGEKVIAITKLLLGKG